MFDSAATELIKKSFFFFFLKCSVLGGFGLYFSMSDEVSCPARRLTSYCLAAEALPYCCVIRAVPADSAVVSATPCGGVSSL